MRAFPKRISHLSGENETPDSYLAATVERIYLDLLSDSRAELARHKQLLRYRIVDRVNDLLKRLPLVQPVFKRVLKTAGLLARLVGPRKRKPQRVVPAPAMLQHLTNIQAEWLLARCSRQPLISVVVAVTDARPELLEFCLQSVQRQLYPHWELLVVVPATPPPEIDTLLRTWAERESRIRLLAAGDVNAALVQAAGVLVGFLAAEDELTPDALAWVVLEHNQHPEALWLYSDEDRINEGGHCLDNVHKPDFSLEHLLATAFTCRFSVFAADVLRQLGGMRSGLDRAAEHDLALRAAEVVPTAQIGHIPRVLYHRRAGAEPTANRNVVVEALARRGVDADVSVHPDHPDVLQLKFRPRAEPHVTLVVPTKNAADLVRTCVESVHTHTRYSQYEIVIIDNRSDDPALFAYLDAAQREGKLRATKYDKPFNHSEMNNEVVQAVSSEFVVFLNNDIEILCDDWLEQLVGTAQSDPSIAAVGALLLYPDRTIQHAGIYLAASRGGAGHRHCAAPGAGPESDPRAHTLQEMSALTAALLLVRRSAFLEVGGFNAERYPTDFNDVDLCLKLRRAGYRCVYNPMVQAIHYESKTRSKPMGVDHLRRLRQDWGQETLADPFFNPNLSPHDHLLKKLWPYPVERDFPLELGLLDPTTLYLIKHGSLRCS